MPVISEFYGIKVLMYFDEHNPPHFHVQYGEFKAEILIGNLNIERGFLPKRALRLVREWADQHQEDLLENWFMLEKGQGFNKIQPLE